MTDIALNWQRNRFDIALIDDDLESDAGLDTAVTLSLFCDARAGADDGLVQGADPRGWWGDALSDIDGDTTGAKLWLLPRKKLAGVLQQAEQAAETALAWLINDGIAATVTAHAHWLGDDGLALNIAIARPHGPPFNRAYQYVWSDYQ